MTSGIEPALWRNRQAGFAAFHAWEERTKARVTPGEEDRERRIALEAVDLWRRFLPEGERRPKMDLEKARGIQAMRAALERVRSSR